MLTSAVRNVGATAGTWYIWTKSVTLRIVFLSLVFLLLLWISVFLYGSFYYAYMPTSAHERPVYLQFRECEAAGSITGSSIPCSYYPTANVTLVPPEHQGQQLLMKGQSYRVLMDIDMPQSPVNENIGMFMVTISFYTDGGSVVSVSSRPAILPFKSFLLKILDTLFHSPLLVGGFAREKQNLEVELFENFQDNVYKPAIGALVTFETKKIEIYSTTLKLQAHFTGLRYLMFHWPTATAFTSIFTNFMLLATVVMLSWYRWFSGENDFPHEVVRMDYARPPGPIRPAPGDRQPTGRAALERSTEGVDLPALPIATNDEPLIIAQRRAAPPLSVATLFPTDGASQHERTGSDKSSDSNGDFENVEDVIPEQPSDDTNATELRLRHT
ncbi:seipin-like [Saccoglossus kowalevskii]|uniref:Seipin n=1 Tax=Saccoglossus kowalevskii TaxID=10224 RepID=A0ABM0MBA5_SACKO|nr:PREDICTED: seipin-like [Saccoglossus kowalevskii]